MPTLAVLVLVISACGTVATHAPDAGAPDTPAGNDAADAGGLAAFSTPVPIAELASTSTDGDPYLTADQLEIVFTSTRAGGAGGEDVWTATRASTADAWSTPVPVAEVNTADNEQHPVISADGL